ncbi:MAG: nucleotidyltransferase family protein [Clostridiales bacterium]|nr:nucleotidyltransferase family protein [Clostridiales bacterium]
MTIAAVICEYNPFHNGHKYHIEQTRVKTGVDFVAAVMSGNYVQRGEPAMFDKWSRTKMALLCGVDLVVELPSVFSCSSAAYFANGAIDIAGKIGADFLSFGSENTNLHTLDCISSALLSESPEFKVKLKASLKNGNTLAKSKQDAMNTEKFRPNEILAIEYLIALKKKNSKIIPVAVERRGNEYNDILLSGKLSSASAVRKAINTDDNSVWEAIPEEAASIIKEELFTGRAPITFIDFNKIIVSNLLSLGPAGIKQLPFVSEGLENKIYHECLIHMDTEKIIQNCTCRRYTSGRIRRILTSTLTGVTAQTLKKYSENGVPYIKILGFKKKAEPLVKKISEKLPVPLITRPGSDVKKLAPYASYLLELEKTASNLYSLGRPDPASLPDAEFTQKLIIY